MNVALRFSRGRFTPKATSWQALCLHPDHQADGRRCTKSRSNALSGGSDRCLRILQVWLLRGSEAADSRAHFDLFDEIADIPDESLPNQDEVARELDVPWPV